MTSCTPPPLVAHIIYALRAGGLENGLVNIINRMPADRYRHAIICLTDASEFAERITVDNVEIIQLRKRPGHDFSIYCKVWKVLRRLKPDIVHTRNLNSLEMQFLAFFLPKIKRVHGEHGRDMNDLEGKNRKFNFFRWLMSLFVHRYITVSRDLQHWLMQVVRIPSRKVRYIYNGVDQSRFSSFHTSGKTLIPAKFIADDVLIVGTVGRLAEVKNQQLLIRAIQFLLNTNEALKQKLRLVIVGDGPMRKSLEEQVTTAGFKELVWFAGDRDDIPDLLQQMDIFVLPSLAEGISNTILEAMSTALPVIATEVGGNSELVNEISGVLVPSGNVAAMSKAILNLLENPDRRLAMGYAAQQRVREDFNWNTTVTNYMEVYDELLVN